MALAGRGRSGPRVIQVMAKRRPTNAHIVCARPGAPRGPPCSLRLFRIGAAPAFRIDLLAAENGARRHRGIGLQFVKTICAKLTELGIRFVYLSSKVEHDWGVVLRRLGFHPNETIYSRRLDLPAPE